MKKFLSFLVLLMVGLGITGCTKDEYYRYDFNLGSAFQTVSNVTLVSKKITEEEFSRLETEMIAILDGLDETFNVIDRGDHKVSMLMEVNNQAGIAPVEVSREVIEVLLLSIETSELSIVEGVALFDVTIAPVWDKWDFVHQYYIDTIEFGVIPTKEEIEELLPLVDYRKIQIDEIASTVYLSEEGMKIDLGGVVKGYAADQIKTYLIEQGYDKAIIDVGRNILLLGSFINTKYEDAPWKVSMQRPYAMWYDGNSKQTYGSVYLVDKTVVTSGVYEKYILTEDEVEYHHILDPRTGYPFDNNVVTLTVITDLSIWADALSTMLFAFGLERGLEYVNQTEGVECVYVVRAGDTFEVYVSQGLKDTFIFNKLVEEYQFIYKGTGDIDG